MASQQIKDAEDLRIMFHRELRHITELDTEDLVWKRIAFRLFVNNFEMARDAFPEEYMHPDSEAYYQATRDVLRRIQTELDRRDEPYQSATT